MTSTYARDKKTGLILNMDESGLAQYEQSKRNVKALLKTKRELDDTKNQISSLQDEMDEMKSLIKQLLDKENLMAYTITPVQTTDTFQVWFDTTNLLVNAVSTIAVTVNTHANGGLTTGNGFVEGTFGARSFAANTFRGGTVQTPAVLTLTSNLNVTGQTVTVGTVVINSSGISIAGIPLETGGGSFESSTTGTSGQIIDSWDKILYRAAEYSVSVKDNTANAYQFARVMVIHDSGDAYYTEFATVSTNTALGDFSANANATHIRLAFTPTSTNTSIDGARVLVEV